VSEDPYGAAGLVCLDVPGESIRCITKDKKPWKRMSRGSKVKLLGRAGDSDNQLHSVEIVEAGPNPGVVISARKLSREFDSNRTAAKKKYDWKYAYVEGEIIEKTNDQGGILVKLQGEKNITILCAFGSSANTRALSRSKVGQTMSVFGRLSLFDGERDNIIHLRECALTQLK
jgi:hypothetical protein